MTNPLDMKGPEFLGFYILYGVGIFLFVSLLRQLWHRAYEAPQSGRWSPGIYPREEDAYAIALLRGGPEEVARTSLGRLVAEGFLILDTSTLRPSNPPPRDRSRLAPLDQVVLDAAAELTVDPGPRDVLVHAIESLKPRLEPLSQDLENAGLIPGDRQRWGYLALGLAALLAVTGLGTAKLLVAMSRGHGNVGFLIILLVFSVLVSIRLLKPPLQTAAGSRYLDWLKESHKGLATMLNDGRRQGFGELALAAGIFGISSFPMLTALQLALTPPRPSAASGSDGGSSCGSGDSGGSSGCGSSGCGGGGGCGGGCGGCGG